VNGGIVSIAGLPPFPTSAVTSANCFRACKTDCVKQAVTITPTVPSATCECPYLWEMRLVGLPCLKTYRTDETFERVEEYNYTDKSGAALTVNAIVTSVVAQINGNPDSIITAAAVGSAGSYTDLAITEKDCDSEHASCGFNVYVSTGTFSSATGHTGAILSDAEIAREFPITYMAFMNRPALAYCGSYCKYNFRINGIGTIADLQMPNSTESRYLDVEIFVNKEASTFFTDWDTPLATALTCFGATLDPTD
jgi:hypothetical protein